MTYSFFSPSRFDLTGLLFWLVEREIESAATGGVIEGMLRRLETQRNLSLADFKEIGRASSRDDKHVLDTGEFLLFDRDGISHIVSFSCLIYYFFVCYTNAKEMNLHDINIYFSYSGELFGSNARN